MDWLIAFLAAPILYLLECVLIDDKPLYQRLILSKIQDDKIYKDNDDIVSNVANQISPILTSSKSLKISISNTNFIEFAMLIRTSEILTQPYIKKYITKCRLLVVFMICSLIAIWYIDTVFIRWLIFTPNVLFSILFITKAKTKTSKQCLDRINLNISDFQKFGVNKVTKFPTQHTKH